MRRGDNSRAISDLILSLARKPPHSAKRRYAASWNPLTQPVSVREFARIGVTAEQVQLASRKLAEIRQKLSPAFVWKQLKFWYSSCIATTHI